MCHEGGCGACIVSVEIRGEIMSVNSCLVPVLMCSGSVQTLSSALFHKMRKIHCFYHSWAITTIEGLGSKKEGYHTLQAALAQKNGSQCGYCSPGMVMNMYRCVTSHFPLICCMHIQQQRTKTEPKLSGGFQYFTRQEVDYEGNRELIWQ